MSTVRRRQETRNHDPWRCSTAVGVAAEVKSRLQIADVVGETVALKKAGTTFKGLCPFRGDPDAMRRLLDLERQYHEARRSLDRRAEQTHLLSRTPIGGRS